MIGQCPCKRQIAQTHLVGLLGCASVTGIVVRLSRLHCGLLPPTETRLLRPLAVLDCCLLLCCHSSTENRLPRLQRFIRPEKAMSKRQEELWIPASCEARLTHIPHPSRLARSRFPTRASRSAAASLCSFLHCLASFWHTGWVPLGCSILAKCAVPTSFQHRGQENIVVLFFGRGGSLKTSFQQRGQENMVVLFFWPRLQR